MKATLCALFLLVFSSASFGYTRLAYRMYIDPDICFPAGIYSSDPAGYNYNMGSYYFNPGYYWFEPSFYYPRHGYHRYHRHHRHHRHYDY